MGHKYLLLLVIDQNSPDSLSGIACQDRCNTDRNPTIGTYLANALRITIGDVSPEMSPFPQTSSLTVSAAKVRQRPQSRNISIEPRTNGTTLCTDGRALVRNNR